MIKRIVIDGAPGSGKSTVLVGRSHEDTPNVRFDCLQDRNFQVIQETISVVFGRLRAEGKDPIENIEEAVDRIVKAEIQRYSSPEGDGIVYFDRGLPGYETIANRYGVELSSQFLTACTEMRYDSPIFLFKVIEKYNMSKPRGRSSARVYSLQERLQRHTEAKACYEKLGYDVLEVPVFSSDVQKSINKRIEFMLQALD